MVQESNSGEERANAHGVEEFPEELARFFTQEQGRVLLARGDPGAGKTLFAIKALDVLRRHGGDILYVSTRVDTDTIYRNYLADKTDLTRSNVLDISQDPFDADITPAEDLGTERFDPESFLEWLQAVADVSTPLTIAFDSWELVQQYILSHARRDETIEPDALVTRIATLARRHGIRVILVTEQAEQTNLDYVSDGVVELCVEHSTGGRPERTLVLEKLRGVRIQNRTRPFSLSEERFQVFSPISLPLSRRSHRTSRWVSITNTKSKFSTGIADLDAMLGGGYNRGSVVHFELGPDLSRDAWSLPCLATARNFLSHGMGVAAVPLPESSPGLVRNHLEPILSESPFEASCDVFETYDHESVLDILDHDGDALDRNENEVDHDGDELNPGDELDHDGDGTTDMLGADTQDDRSGGFRYSEYLRRVERLREQSDGPLLHIISMDAAGDALIDVMSDHATYIALHNDLSILVTKPGSDEQTRADRIADVHLRMERRGETIFLYGENPVTPFLGFDSHSSEDVLNVGLMEMV